MVQDFGGNDHLTNYYSPKPRFEKENLERIMEKRLSDLMPDQSAKELHQILHFLELTQKNQTQNKT